MATVTAARPAATTTQRIPWYLWCAALAVTSVTVGAHWDVSWHRSIGRDTFWTPAHLAIYMCGILAGICCGYLILATTILRPAQLVASSVRIFGFRGPLGAFLAAWGGIAMLTSAPFDNWWHNAYGLDVKIVSPPHTVLMLGVWGVGLGALFMIVAAMNRAETATGPESTQFRHLQWLMLYVSSMLLILNMFFRMQYTWDPNLHSTQAYMACALGTPLYFAAIHVASRNRWAATWISVIYTVFVCLLILILPLFPAEPKLGPVYQHVTQFIPPKFPILLIVPGIAVDLLLTRAKDWKPWLTALVAGPVFVFSLVAVEWPFANFLMSKAAENWFFGTGYHDYSMPSTSVDITRKFFQPEHGLILWKGLAEAALCASVITWLGLALGRWMKKIQR